MLTGVPSFVWPKGFWLMAAFEEGLEHGQAQPAKPTAAKPAARAASPLNLFRIRVLRFGCCSAAAYESVPAPRKPLITALWPRANAGILRKPCFSMIGHASETNIRG